MTVDLNAVLTLIVTLAGSSVLTGIIVAMAARKKVAAEADSKKADAAKKIEEASSGLIDHYREAYEELKENMEQCVREIKELKDTQKELERKLVSFEGRHKKLLDVIERLVHQVKSLNHHPVCTPDDIEGI